MKGYEYQMEQCTATTINCLPLFTGVEYIEGIGIVYKPTAEVAEMNRRLINSMLVYIPESAILRDENEDF